VEIADALLDVFRVDGRADGRSRAPRERRLGRPSLRFTPPASSLPAPALAPGFAGAPGRIEPFVTADFFVFAISISVRDKPLKSYGFVPVFPPARLGRLAGVTRAKTPRANYQSYPLRVYSRNASGA
jgi:hypothetical protein